MSGNPVEIGDGCATVSGYRLPQPPAEEAGKAGARLEAASQDTGQAVLVRAPQRGARFSAEEKDEASPAPGLRGNQGNVPSGILWWSRKAFCFPGLHPGLAQ